MSSINYDEINYPELITFLSVARTLNMTISANELNISQPAVSKRIHRLENHYDIILFLRTNTGLQLTPAGKVFYQEILSSCEHIESAFTKAAAVQASPIRTLTLGYDGFFDIPILYEIVNRFHLKYSNAVVKVYNYYKETCTDLFNGTADIMISPNSFFSSVTDHVESEPIGAFQFSIIVSKHNPLAQKEFLGIQDLLGVSLTVAHMNSDSPYINALNTMFMKYGFSPKIEHLVMRDNLCFEILAENGVGIASPGFWKRLNQRTSDFFSENIRVYPIPNETYPVSFVWRANNRDENIGRFLKVYREVISEGDNKENVKAAYNSQTD